MPSSSFSYIRSISACICRCVRRLSTPSTTPTARTAENPATSLKSRLRRSSQLSSAFISARLANAVHELLQIAQRALARLLVQLREVQSRPQPGPLLDDEVALRALPVEDVLQREAADL